MIFKYLTLLLKYTPLVHFVMLVHVPPVDIFKFLLTPMISVK